MVSYQKWTSIAFKTAEAKGADTSKNQEAIISTAADIWSDRKDELSTARVDEAERIAETEITVA